MTIGLLLMALPHTSMIKLTTGAILTGLGYGVMQPIVYDKAATNSPPNLATMALSLVMVVNYLAILVAPFIIEYIDWLFHTTSHSFAFIFNSLVTTLLAAATLLLYRHNRVLGSDD